jgi:hypothetical protein
LYFFPPVSDPLIERGAKSSAEFKKKKKKMKFLLSLGGGALALLLCPAAEARLLRHHPLVTGAEQALPRSRDPRQGSAPFPQLPTSKAEHKVAGPPGLPAGYVWIRIFFFFVFFFVFCFFFFFLSHAVTFPHSVTIENYAGYIPVDVAHEGALFYWYFPRDKANSGTANGDADGKDPLTIVA